MLPRRIDGADGDGLEVSELGLSAWEVKEEEEEGNVVVVPAVAYTRVAFKGDAAGFVLVLLVGQTGEVDKIIGDGIESNSAM
jgi:hypothetical protein